MRSFALWLRDEDEETHPVVKAAIASIHLVAIHPFWDGNGRTARALATLVLQRSQFHFKKLLSLESYTFAILDRYFTAMERTLGTRFSLDYDATGWLVFFSLALGVHVEELTTRLTDWHRMMQDIYGDLEKLGLTQRQVDGFAFVVQAGEITRSHYVEITGVSPVTASRDLAKLVDLGVLVPEGNTRSRIYRRPPSDSPSGPQAACSFLYQRTQTDTGSVLRPLLTTRPRQP